MHLAEMVPDAAGDRVGEILDVFVFHFLAQGHQISDRFAHRRNLLVAPPTTFAMAAFLGALAGTGIENHVELPGLLNRDCQLTTVAEAELQPGSNE
jgi:hypothetical protein